MDYYNKGEYAPALVYLKQVKEKCGEYKLVSSLIKECEDNLNTENKTNISIDKNSVSFNPQGGTEVIKVSAENTSWYFGKAPEWLRLSKNKGRLVVECEGNASGEERSVDLRLFFGEGEKRVTKKIHVIQFQSVMSVSSNSLNFPEYGGAINRIQVYTNDDWDVASQSDVWFKIEKTDNDVSVSCEANPYAKVRQGSFELTTSNNTAQTITITQDPSSPVFEIEETSIKVKWNEGDRTIKVNTNVPDWRVEGITTAWWCEMIKKSDQELLLRIKEHNESGYSREVKYKLIAGNIDKEITITQRTLGYQSLYEDYFDNTGGTIRITPVSASVYGGGSWGIRVSGYMVRWKVIEADLLNLNMSFSKSFLLSWEPMVRGYLPLQRDGLAWTAYLGVGGCVPFIDSPLNGNYNADHSKLLLETGAEFNFKLKRNQTVSSRVFIRIDGTFSIGAAFDLHKWK